MDTVEIDPGLQEAWAFYGRHAADAEAAFDAAQRVEARNGRDVSVATTTPALSDALNAVALQADAYEQYWQARGRIPLDELEAHARAVDVFIGHIAIRLWEDNEGASREMRTAFEEAIAARQQEIGLRLDRLLGAIHETANVIRARQEALRTQQDWAQVVAFAIYAIQRVAYEPPRAELLSEEEREEIERRAQAIPADAEEEVAPAGVLLAPVETVAEQPPANRPGIRAAMRLLATPGVAIQADELAANAYAVDVAGPDHVARLMALIEYVKRRENEGHQPVIVTMLAQSGYRLEIGDSWVAPDGTPLGRSVKTYCAVPLNQPPAPARRGRRLTELTTEERARRENVVERLIEFLVGHQGDRFTYIELAAQIYGVASDQEQAAIDAKIIAAHVSALRSHKDQKWQTLERQGLQIRSERQETDRPGRGGRTRRIVIWAEPSAR